MNIIIITTIAAIITAIFMWMYIRTVLMYINTFYCTWGVVSRGTVWHTQLW